MPSDARFNAHVKRDRLPSPARLIRATPFFARAFAQYAASRELGVSLRQDVAVRFATIPANVDFPSENAQTGAVLRWLLADDPVVDLIVATLTEIGSPVSMRTLAQRSIERDRVRAVTVFFNPEPISEITDDRGAVVWSRVEPRHFRSTTFYQYKSMLKHAGMIAPHRLGGASTRGYDPDSDIWELKLAHDDGRDPLSSAK